MKVNDASQNDVMVAKFHGLREDWAERLQPSQNAKSTTTPKRGIGLHGEAKDELWPNTENVRTVTESSSAFSSATQIPARFSYQDAFRYRSLSIQIRFPKHDNASANRLLFFSKAPNFVSGGHNRFTTKSFITTLGPANRYKRAPSNPMTPLNNNRTLLHQILGLRDRIQLYCLSGKGCAFRYL